MKKLFFLLAFSLLLTGCLGSKKVTEKTVTTNTSNKEKQSRDSISATQINKAIADALDLYVPPQVTDDKKFDEAVNNAVDQIMLKLNLNKQSGDNSYSLYYDLIKRELQFRASVGETKNSNTDVKETKETEKTFEQKSDEYIYKKITTLPWWVYVLAVFFLLPNLINSVTAIYMPFKNILKKNNS